jgi:hypothetical protein
MSLLLDFGVIESEFDSKDASQGTHLCTASVKFASRLHHDKGTCCFKV